MTRVYPPAVAMPRVVQSRWLAALALALVSPACATPPTPSARPPEIAAPPVAAAAPPAAPRDPFEIPELSSDPPIPEEPAEFRGAIIAGIGDTVFAAPATCAAWVLRPRTRVAACDTRDAGRAVLDWALDDRQQDDDSRLASIEGCKGLEPGLARAVRVERAPVECGDVLAMPLLAKPPAGLTGPIFHALYGHAIAARAARIAAAADRGTPRPASDQGNRDLALTKLLESLEEATAQIPRSYGRAVALAGIAAAWMQLGPAETSRVDRASFAAVEAARGEGISDGRLLGWARGWLTEPFGWLAEIGLLQWPAAEPGSRGPRPPRPRINGALAPRDGWDDSTRALSLTGRLAEDLPSFLAARVLDDSELSSVDALRAFASKKSLPARVRVGLGHGSPSTEATLLAARARLALGVRFFDRREVDGAISLLASQPVAERSDAARILLAVGLALHAGPRDLAEWTRKPVTPESFDLRALDALAGTAGGEARTLAAFDASVLRDLEAGPVAGEIAPLEAQLHGYERMGDPIRSYVKERASALGLLLKQIHGDAAEPAYSASTPIRFEGWPRVHVGSQAWYGECPPKAMTCVSSTANRTGSVNRALRRLSYRFEQCFTEASAASPTLGGSVGLHFVIDRAGSVGSAVAKADAPEGARLAHCVAAVTRGLLFTQPEIGVWTIDVRLRVGEAAAGR